MSELKDYIKIGYRNYKLDVWPDTFASTEEAEGEFFAKDGKHGANTLLHEILHAIVYQYGLAEDIKDKEEKIVNTLTNGLSAVFIDNPWLLDYLKDKVKKEKESVNEKTK